DQLRTGYDRPNLKLPVSQKDKFTVRKYYLTVAEVYGEKQTIRKQTVTTIKTALYGGISKEMLDEFIFPGFFMRSGKVLFLKQEPDEVKVYADQPEFLTWCAFEKDEASVTLHAKLYFGDNTTDTRTIATFPDVKQYDRFTFAVGILHNNWHLIKPDQPILKYELVMKNAAGTEISPVKTYYVDYDQNPYLRFFIFLSSWGTYDTLVSAGKGSYDYDLTSSAADITQVGKYQLADGDTIDFAASMAQTESVATGFRENRREIRRFRDLFLSTDRFLMRKGRIYPITINSKSIKEFQDGNQLPALSFEIGTRYKETVWTFDDKDDQPRLLAFPIIVGGGLGGSIPDNYFDWRFYRKTETYNKSEVDDKFSQFNQTLNELYGQIQDANALILLLQQNKAEVNHNHDERYMLIADYARLPIVATIDSDFYRYENGATILEDVELLGGFNALPPVRSTQLNYQFKPAELVYDDVLGKVTIANFQLTAGNFIIIG
ncbi:MAG: hypothetical protein INR69_21610, partial [Mucilaginibacter polytrichastri]|nr:hypothetical protein [Mucilaginibacter polytrichastri]